MWRKFSATYVLPISRQGDTLKNFKDQSSIGSPAPC